MPQAKITSVNPTTGEVLQEFQPLSDQQLEQKFQKAQQAFEQLKNASLEQRSQWMSNLGDVLNRNAEKYGRTVTLEMGKTISQAVYEAQVSAKFAKWYADNGKNLLEDKTVDSLNLTSKVMKVHEPYGILYQIAPFNYPLWQCYRFLTASVMAGNVALIKHSHITNMTGMNVEQSFREAGFPEGTVQLVIVTKDQSNKIIADPRIMGVTITGSTSSGKAIAKLAAENLKKQVMELGGCDPYIIRDDVDLDEIMPECVRGRVSNCGQCCVASKRYLVMESIYDEFVQKYVEQMKKVKVGNPLDKDVDMGPMARTDLRDTVHKQVEQAVQEGAKLLLGGKIPEQKGNFYPPTVLADVTPDNLACRDEIFGPVAAIMKVRDEKEAVEIANKSKFGLGGGVFSKDVNKAIEIAKKIQAGMTFINRTAVFGPQIPFGGLKDSGYGKECGEEGLFEWVNIKSVVVK
jgi:succinate-semialdehyde dehydrogenase/glutarate-semialdehyde dehydrogenase